MGTASMDADLVGTLTVEERAAIDDTDVEAEALQAVADGAEADEGDDDDDAPADPALAPKAEQPAAAADAQPAAAAAADADPVRTTGDADPAAAEAAADPVKPVAQAAAPVPFDFKLPDDFQERKEALKEAKAQLRARRNEGDLSNEEYDTEIDRLADEAMELAQIESQAMISARMHQQAEATQRTNIANAVLESAKGAGLDYSTDEEKFAELQATMKALKDIPAHANKGFEHVIREADRRVRLAHGIGLEAPKPTTPAAPAAAPTPAQAKAKAAKDRQVSLDDAPKTLAQVPGGQGAGDVGGEFDDIMALEGEAYEDAIAALSKNPARFAKFQSQMQ